MYFHPKKEITLQVDTLLKGLGAVLYKTTKPIAFASKALTDVETRYANIEKELLVYGCESPFQSTQTTSLMTAST